MTTTVHLIVGPTRHGVCRHGEQVARALGDRVVRIEAPNEFDFASVEGADVVHIPYTDQLFGKRCEESAIAFSNMVEPIVAARQALSITLHDLPAGDDERENRRRTAYTQVIADARGVVVNSQRELLLLDQLDDHARSRRQIPLPVATFEPADLTPDSDVVVLGFLFPDRGYEHTINELPVGSTLTALGSPAVGHEHLPAKLAALAAQRGCSMRTTGFVEDADLAAALARAGVPVAPNRRVAASASIATWIGHGRRPLVPDSPYSRELASQWPGTVTIYDADVPGALQSAIDAALADPSLTFLGEGVAAGPSIEDVGNAYREHFDVTAPEKPVSVEGGRWVVPDNRWDLLDFDAEPAMVSVVIPYYEAQAHLDRVLAALTKQTHPLARLQVVVADDGSRDAPNVSAAEGLSVAVVRQANEGFRAAAARNLGAEAAEGDVLLFLDGDTYPEPDYVKRMSRLPALAPDVLAVGRRLHADFSQQPPVELDEPAWLVEAYRDSANLLNVNERSYRYVISAVMGMHRDLFTEVGGFSEEFTSYGGEDWELAHRSYVAGAVLAHVRDAVAWHDGPEWAEREGVADKNTETFALARVIPDAVLRGGGQWVPYPAVAIQLHTSDVAAALATVRSAFVSNADCGFWIDDRAVVEAIDDQRVRFGSVPAEVAARALIVADIVPCDLLRLPELITRVLATGRVETPAGSLVSTRALARERRWGQSNSVTLFGHQQVAWPLPFGRVDLHHQLKKVHENRPR